MPTTSTTSEEIPAALLSSPIPLSTDRIWIDGCFDFTHHGHAGAMLQAKLLGHHLCVGVHSDAAITLNKGPPVMTLAERLCSVAACKWSNEPVPNAPYVTDPKWMDAYGCQFVVHGDDVTTDADGDDCYRVVKAAGRFKVVKRTPGISTTDLVGRMLLCTKGHHLKEREMADLLLHRGDGGFGSAVAEEWRERVEAYASDEFGVKGRGSTVFYWEGDGSSGKSTQIVAGKGPRPGQPIVYVDGGFDLFTPGHIEFLRLVAEASKTEENAPYIIAGVHSDGTINRWKGLNYPIMNLYERSLCVLQCRHVACVVFNAPYVPSKHFLESLPWGVPSGVWHGPTNFMEERTGEGREMREGERGTEVYADARALGVYRELERHEWVDMNARVIVERILRKRVEYEVRQRRKEGKGEKEVGMEN